MAESQIPLYRPFCDAAKADYGGKTRNIGRYLPLQEIILEELRDVQQNEK